MQTIQERFFAIQDIRKERRTLREVYRDALASDADHQDITKQLRKLQEQRREIERKIKDSCSAELEKIDDLTEKIKEERERLTNEVIASISKGEIIKVRDQHNISYDPVIRVTFKRTDEVKQ